MARPKKQGLDYFPLDVDFFGDMKIKILKSRYGSDGMMIYLYLLCEIYKNGYYIKMNEDYEYVIKDELNLNESVVEQVMQFLFNRSLLKSILVGSDTYITSSAIQNRFQEAVKTRKLPVTVNADLWLLKKEETLGCIKVTQNCSKSEINCSKSEINATKESKVKESKVDNNIYYYVSSDAKASPDTSECFISLILNDKTYFSVTNDAVAHYKELYPAVDIEQELRNMCGWLEANPTKRKTNTGIKSFITKWLKKCQDQGGIGYGRQSLPINNTQTPSARESGGSYRTGEKVL